MKENSLIHYLAFGPSITKQLLQRKNRKCFIALCLLTFMFLSFLAISTTFADEKTTLDELKQLETDFVNEGKITVDKVTFSQSTGGYEYKLLPKTTKTMWVVGSEVVSLPVLILVAIPKVCTACITLDNSQMPAFFKDITGDFMPTLTSLAKTTVPDAVIPPMQGIAYAIVAIHFLAGMIELSMSERMTLEAFIKWFSKLVVGVAAIFYCPDIFKLLFQFGTSFASWISTQLGKVSITSAAGKDPVTIYIGLVRKVLKSGADAVTDQYQTMGMSLVPILLFLIALVIAGIVFLIVGVLVMIASMVIAITRIFEIIIRGCFLPIGIATLADDGWHGSGGRYFKKLAAVMIQAAVIVLISQVMSWIMLATTTNILKGDIVSGSQMIASFIGPIFIIIECLVVTIAGLAAMFKSGQYANDIMGV